MKDPNSKPLRPKHFQNENTYTHSHDSIFTISAENCCSSIENKHVPTWLPLQFFDINSTVKKLGNECNV